MNKKHQIIIVTFVLLSLVAASLFISERVKFSEFQNQSQQIIGQLTDEKQSSDSATAKLKSEFDTLKQKSQALETEFKTQGIDLANCQALCEKQAKEYEKLSQEYNQALDTATQSQQLAEHYEKVSQDILAAWKGQVEE
jgi:biopolymer transport protein ExbB/TolQ